jgi:hypothetical protein
MIARASGPGTGVCRFSRPLRQVGVLAMPDAGLDTMQHIESVCVFPLGAGRLHLLVPSVAVGVIRDRRCVADVVKVTY